MPAVAVYAASGPAHARHRIGQASPGARRSDARRSRPAVQARGETMKIGFIGTGTMGQPMVNNLIKKGFGVIAYDIDAAALAAAAKLGAATAASAAEAARATDLLITMVPSSTHAEMAYLGEGGVFEGAAAGLLCVDMSTIDPGTTRRLAEAARRRGVRFMDAPVSGGTPGAIEGTLTIMVGGEAADLDEARPALLAIGASIIHVGPVGSGEVAKLCNNLLSGVAMVAVSEAFRIAEAFGVGPRMLTDVIS